MNVYYFTNQAVTGLVADGLTWWVSEIRVFKQVWALLDGDVGVDCLLRERSLTVNASLHNKQLNFGDFGLPPGQCNMIYTPLRFSIFPWFPLPGQLEIDIFINPLGENNNLRFAISSVRADPRSFTRR